MATEVEGLDRMVHDSFDINQHQCSILSLANELIEVIFLYPCISHKEISYLSQTCKRLHAIALGNELWRKKANQRWTMWRYGNYSYGNWREKYKQRHLTEIRILDLLHKMSRNCYKKEDVPNDDFEPFIKLSDTNVADIEKYIDDTFHQILEWGRYKDLTLKYYARKACIFSRVHHLKKVWCRFLLLPEKDQHLEKGAILIEQWCNPLDIIPESDVMKQLDEIAELVRQKTLHKSPSEEKSIADRRNAFLYAIKEVLFDELKFTGNSKNYYDVENSFVRRVFQTKSGIPITLSIVFAAVARRLGVELEPVNFPTHFLLRYPCAVGSDRNKRTVYKYVDAFHGGRILSEAECLEFLNGRVNVPVQSWTLFPKATPRQVFTRMMANIVNIRRSSTSMDIRSLAQLRNSLELMLLLCPDDDEHRLMLSRIYLHQNINLDEVVDSLRQLSSSRRSNLQTGLLGTLLSHALEQQKDEEEVKVASKYRSYPENAEVVYRIGMVMHHRRFDYFCVIYGWDHFCNMEEAWKIQMGVYNLSHGANQPFYNVLAHDGSCRYASQESLEPVLEEARPIPHPEVGRHFKEFSGWQYIPNEHLDELYPEDHPIPKELTPAKIYKEQNVQCTASKSP